MSYRAAGTGGRRWTCAAASSPPTARATARAGCPPATPRTRCRWAPGRGGVAGARPHLPALPSVQGASSLLREHAPAVRAWPGGGFGRTPAQRRDTRGPRGTRASPAAAAPSIAASGVTPRRPHGSRAGRAAEPRSGPLPGRLSQETLRPRLGPPCPGPPQAPDSESPPCSFSELQPRHPSEHRAALLALRLRLCISRCRLVGCHRPPVTGPPPAAHRGGRKAPAPPGAPSLPGLPPAAPAFSSPPTPAPHFILTPPLGACTLLRGRSARRDSEWPAPGSADALWSLSFVSRGAAGHGVREGEVSSAPAGPKPGAPPASRERDPRPRRPR